MCLASQSLVSPEVLIFPHGSLSTDAWASQHGGAQLASFQAERVETADYLKVQPSKFHSDSHDILLVKASHRIGRGRIDSAS